MDKDTTKSTLAKYFSPLNVDPILKEIDRLKVNRYTKKLDARTFINLFVFAQVHQIGSLTDISLRVAADGNLQVILGLESISTSQLSRRLRDLPPEMMDFVLNTCVVEIRRQCGTKVTNQRLGQIHLVDSSTISMCLTQYRWAEYRRTKAGVKLHLRLVFSDQQVYPDKLTLTHARMADKKQMDELVVVELNALNVFDRGYVDYRKFDEYSQQGIRFVTRLKENAIIHEVVEERAVNPESPVRRDAFVRLGSFPNYVMEHQLRLVETVDTEGNRVVILTNDLTLNAQEISDLYRKRWQIELFFKWIKQHLVIKHLYGKSEMAVYNQLRLGLVTYCLLVLLQLNVEHRGRLLEIFKYIRLHWADEFALFVRVLHAKPERTSIGRRRWSTERIFEETLHQFQSGETEHLDTLTYDPLI